MRKISVFAALVCVMLLCTGCKGSPYSFRKPIDQIERIEIVNARNSTDYVVIKTLSEEEKGAFLEAFSQIKFHPYIYGDPMGVFGDCVKFTYSDGSYEIICYVWGEYVRDPEKPGTIKHNRKYCDEKEFADLICEFLKV